jgi:quercetin dioxygenase-like cupin family protein
MSYLLEGEVVIEQDGQQPITVRPGGFLNCPKGTKSRWIIRKTCKKVFVLRSPEPMGQLLPGAEMSEGALCFRRGAIRAGVRMNGFS